MAVNRSGHKSESTTVVKLAVRKPRLSTSIRKLRCGESDQVGTCLRQPIREAPKVSILGRHDRG
jgi:hypothetical protein